jgi:Tol biopolymer transport system component
MSHQKLGLYIKSLNGTSEQLLVESVSGTTMSWSPDGKLIVYGVNDPKTGNDLWAVPLAGERKAIPLINTVFDESWPQIS